MMIDQLQMGHSPGSSTPVEDYSSILLCQCSKALQYYMDATACPLACTIVPVEIERGVNRFAMDYSLSIHF